MTKFSMSRSDVKRIQWELYGRNPIIHPPFLPILIADPSVIVPEDSPDGRWHLFAHSLFGIYHYISKDGIQWDKPKRLFGHGMRPFLYYEDGTYCLIYERYREFQIIFAMLPIRWKSHIEMRTSKDLVNFSKPVKLLEPTLDWHRSKKYGDSLSNPYLVKIDDRYILYYSSSLIHVDDCGFNEPKYIGYASSKDIMGPYNPEPEPLVKPNSDDPWGNLGAGSIRIIPCESGYVGFHTRMYMNHDTGHSGSAITLLESDDGFSWTKALPEPILAPTAGWMGTHVYACDTVYRPEKKEVYFYFNARDHWHWAKGKENIGLMIGRL